MNFRFFSIFSYSYTYKLTFVISLFEHRHACSTVHTCTIRFHPVIQCFRMMTGYRNVSGGDYMFSDPFSLVERYQSASFGKILTLLGC